MAKRADAPRLAEELSKYNAGESVNIGGQRWSCVAKDDWSMVNDPSIRASSEELGMRAFNRGVPLQDIRRDGSSSSGRPRAAAQPRQVGTGTPVRKSLAEKLLEQAEGAVEPLRERKASLEHQLAQVDLELAQAEELVKTLRGALDRVDEAREAAEESAPQEAPPQ